VSGVFTTSCGSKNIVKFCSNDPVHVVRKITITDQGIGHVADFRDEVTICADENESCILFPLPLSFPRSLPKSDTVPVTWKRDHVSFSMVSTGTNGTYFIRAVSHQQIYDYRYEVSDGIVSVVLSSSRVPGSETLELCQGKMDPETLDILYSSRK